MNSATRWCGAAAACLALALSATACGSTHSDSQRESPPQDSPSHHQATVLTLRSSTATDAGPTVPAGQPTASGTLPGAPAQPGRMYPLRGGQASETLVTALAKALGLSGAPAYGADGWTLREGGQLLTVDGSAGQRWTLTSINGGVPVPDAGGGSGLAGPAAVTAAKSALAKVLAATGRTGDPVTATATGAGALATATHQVDGLDAVGYGTSLTVRAGGQVYSATGWLGAPQDYRDYPLTGAAAALKRVPGTAPGGMHPDFCVKTSTGGQCAGRAVQVTGARLGLLLTQDSNGTSLLVPAWLMAVRGQTAPLAVVAIASSEVHFAGASATATPTRVN